MSRHQSARGMNSRAVEGLGQCGPPNSYLVWASDPATDRAPKLIEAGAWQVVYPRLFVVPLIDHSLMPTSAGHIQIVAG